MRSLKALILLIYNIKDRKYKQKYEKYIESQRETFYIDGKKMK